ncbi:MAG: hypothetical protein LBD01_02635, partial [Puniceicoccales bacterium]|nr:hypothetical protein [Puniceicoccales bacterium]
MFTQTSSHHSTAVSNYGALRRATRVLFHVFALVAMLFAFALPQTAAAQWSGSDTSAADPYLITSADDLVLLATNVNAGMDYSGEYFRLENDLDLGVSPYNAGAGWTPIGNDYSKPFKGAFDGNGKTISGLFINRTADYQGLFGYIDGGMVKNLGLENVNIKGSDYVGGVAGVVSGGGSLSNCYATGAVSGYNYVGGVAGRMFSGRISNCAALNPSVKATGSNVGRVVGGSSGTLSGNIAWSGISTGGGTAFSGTTTHDGLNGAPKSADELMASTAFSTFTSPPWTVEDKFLLGLNGSPVEMPLHILAAASASAVQEGNGTEDNPYLIKTPLHLAWLAAKVNAGTDYNGVHFRLENDLDL